MRPNTAMQRTGNELAGLARGALWPADEKEDLCQAFVQ